MSKFFTLSAYQTTAEQFFEKILGMRADRVLDIRLKNESQLCGFTKKGDLAYFVPHICHATYIHKRFLRRSHSDVLFDPLQKKAE